MGFMKNFVQEFKEFAMRGNVMDLAIGVIIGGAFGKIVSSLVADVMMPILGLITGNIDFSDLKMVLRAANGDIPALTLNYGSLLQNVFDFTIVAFAIFVVIKLLNKMKKAKEEEPAAEVPNETNILLSEIRDLLAKNKD